MKRLLTTTEIQQLISYANQVKLDGWYYGNKNDFQKRHKNICIYLDHWYEEQLTREYKQSGDAFI